RGSAVVVGPLKSFMPFNISTVHLHTLRIIPEFILIAEITTIPTGKKGPAIKLTINGLLFFHYCKCFHFGFPPHSFI
ncbi:MAG: hypothetical protein WBD61_11310, partial [Desulfobulbales bacterium]